MGRINLKQFIPPILINLIVGIKNKQAREVRKLIHSPRFIPGKISLFNKELLFPDGASVSSTYVDLFEEEIYKFKSENEDPLIIDLGANIGLSLIYFKLLHEKSHIIALEADPSIFKYLKMNVAAYKLENVTLINKAAFDKDTTLNFVSEGADGGRIDLNSKGTIEVEAIDINRIFPEGKTIDFLKIDIEGAELIVLERCKEKLKSVRKLFIEYHSTLDTQPQKLSSILQILEQAGFRYDIRHVLPKKSPFLRLDSSNNGFDLQLEIFAWKNL